jgi:hypothetical protein
MQPEIATVFENIYETFPVKFCFWKGWSIFILNTIGSNVKFLYLFLCIKNKKTLAWLHLSNISS